MGTLPTTEQALQRLAIALCIGLFIGLEREYAQAEKQTESVPAGLRTYGLIGLFGATCCYLGLLVPSVWLLVAGLSGVGALAVVSYIESLRQRQMAGGLGVTSEIGSLLAFVLGAVAMYGQLTVAGVVAVAATVVLSAKKPLHAFVRQMGQEDLVATMKFAVVTFIVLPILPNHAIDASGFFNPRHTWLMVVMIAGIGFMGYALTKFIGAEKGIALTGLVGGLASSTAVTLSSARRSKVAESLSEPLALGVLLACAVMVPRVALIVAALNPAVVPKLLPAGVAMLVASLAFIYLQYQRSRAHGQTDVDHETQHENPFDLGHALKFALAFTVVSVMVKLAQQAHAVGGVYLVSGLSGLVDADAAAISLSQQAKLGLSATVAARGIVITLVVNSLVKGVAAWSVGSRALGRKVLLPMVGVAIVGALVAFLTP